jgi:hypothetical protein
MHRLLAVLALVAGCGSAQPEPAKPTPKPAEPTPTAEATPPPKTDAKPDAEKLPWKPPEDRGPLIKDLPPPDPKPASAETLAALGAFRDRACACGKAADTNACANELFQDIQTWAAKHMDDPSMSGRPPEEVTKITNEMVQCLTKAMK